MKLGIIGLSELGQQHLRFFREYTKHEVLTADADKSKKPNSTFASLAEHADVIFVCVGNRIAEDGGLDPATIEALVKQISEEVAKGIVGNSCVVVLRTAVPVGFTRKLQMAYGNLAIFFVPTFSSAGDMWESFMHPDQYLIGYVPRADAAKDEESMRAAKEIARFLPRPNNHGMEHEVVEGLLKAMAGADVPMPDKKEAPVNIMAAEQAELFTLLSGSLDAIDQIIAGDIKNLTEKAGIDYEPLATALDLLRGETHAMPLLVEARRFAKTVGATILEKGGAKRIRAKAEKTKSIKKK